MCLTVLFTHLKIILLQFFQFSVFSFSNNKFNPNTPYINLQLNPYPITQLDLFYSDNLSFSMHGSQYVTNQ